MGPIGWRERRLLRLTMCGAMLGAGLAAQEPGRSPAAEDPPAARSPATGKARAPEAGVTAAERKRGSRTPPTHAPQPDLPPALILDFVKRSNTAVVKARAIPGPAPAPLRRPAGAGRYLCAVFVCADADLDVARTLGLARRDVLVLSNPGPFVSRESIALLEHQVQHERLGLVLVVTHADCDALTRRRPTSPAQRAFERRVEEARRLARRDGGSLPRALARRQCELLLASSRVLQERADRDAVRVLPAEIDRRTLRLTWHTSRADEMPMKPIK